MNTFAWVCAATSVALGAVFMLVTGAPRHYVVVNAAALVVSVTAASFLVGSRAAERRFAGAVTIAVGAALVATALAGIELHGAARWVRVAGVSLQPSLILLPLATICFSRDRGWSSAIGLMIASTGLALQPDRASSGALAAGLAALWLFRRERTVTAALVFAAAGWVTTMLRIDHVPPMPFVEQVVQAAFRLHVLIGVAVVVGLATLLLPAAVGAATSREGRELFAVFGAIWLAIIVFAIVGPYPTPLVGYGSSAIAGYCLSAATLPRK